MPTNQFRKNEVLLQFKLMDGEEIQGRISWFDNFNISIRVANKEDVEEMTILKHAIVYYFPV